MENLVTDGKVGTESD